MLSPAERALRTVSSQIRFSWQAAQPQFSESGSASQALSELAKQHSGGDKPTLVFYKTRMPGKHERGPYATACARAAKACAMIEETIFFSSPPKLCGTPRTSTRYDFRAGVAGRLFNMVRVDVTGRTKSQDNPVSADMAPVIVVADSKGNVVKTLTGRSINAASVYSAMAAAAKKDGINISQPVTKAARILSALYKVELDIIRARSSKARSAARQVEALTAARDKGRQLFQSALARAGG